MKLALYLTLFLFALFTFGDTSLSLTNYQIKKFCKKQKRELKNLQEKRSDLQEGNLIEIQVIPYKE